jgi:RNA polymerase sigma factor (sigma-70 family)
VANHSTTLRNWIDRHNAGDPEALNELIRYSEDRFRLLAHARLNKFMRLRRFEDTGDVLVGVQLRFSKAIRTLQFATLEDFLRLGAEIVNRQLIDFTRRYFGPLGAGKNEIELSLENSDNSHQRIVAEPAAASTDNSQRQEIDDVIGTLSPADREMFDLLYYQGLTQSETADLLRVSLSTLKRRWLGARAAFMERYCNGENEHFLVS